MDNDGEILKRIYDRFNSRDIDGVLALLADDVIWANGRDGGHVHGREAVREYWIRQWAMVSPHVEPVASTGPLTTQSLQRFSSPSTISNVSRFRARGTG